MTGMTKSTGHTTIILNYSTFDLKRRGKKQKWAILPI